MQDEDKHEDTYEDKPTPLEKTKTHVLKHLDYYLGVMAGMSTMGLMMTMRRSHKFQCECGWASPKCSTKDMANVMGGLHVINEKVQALHDLAK